MQECRQESIKLFFSNFSLFLHFVASSCLRDLSLCQLQFSGIHFAPLARPDRDSGKLVTIKISHCYNVLRRGCNSYKQYVVSILLQHVFIVTILLQHISLVTMQIGCNNVKIKYLLLQRLQLLRNVVTQILVAAINGICSVPNSSSELIFYKNPGGIRADFLQKSGQD